MDASAYIVIKPVEMSTFLALPREIRNIVYSILLTQENTAPQSPSGTRHDRKQTTSMTPYMESCVHYPSESLPAFSAGLLLTCRQLQGEIKETIADLKAKKTLRYKLDCMIEDEQRLYPTWTLIPSVTTDIHTVEADFRLFGDRRNEISAFAGGDGGPGFMIWGLLSLLYRFLDCGPDLLSPSRIGRKVIVNTVVLNVVSPMEPPEGFIPKDCRLRMRRAGLVHPETILREMESEMRILLERSDWTARYADVVYEQVSNFRIALDGVVRTEWDLKAIRAGTSP